jgi:lipooligosaccharide transport system ATP-binding protein
MAEPVIIIENLHKSFGPLKAVRGISCSVPESICFGLLGPNGAGKTTLFKMLYGVSYRDREPASKLSVFGFDPQHSSLAIKYISGVVPQENNLDAELNVAQNLRVYARFYHMSQSRAAQRIDELLEFMELTDKHTAKIRELSGGMKRRLIIARALLNNPKLLILDEPTTGLDPQVRHLIWEKLRNLKRQGMTIILTTHYMEEAFQISDTVLIMNKGERVMEGNPQELVRDGIEPFVLEIYKKEAYAGIAGLLPGRCTRVNDTADVVRIYSCDEAGLKEITSRLKPGDCFMRPSNLEDLFLKTTGSALNAEQ